jgi:hypothetical protein
MFQLDYSLMIQKHQKRITKKQLLRKLEEGATTSSMAPAQAPMPLEVLFMHWSRRPFIDHR